MTIDHDHHDLQIEELLRALGPRLDEAGAPTALRTRVADVLRGRNATDGGQHLNRRIARMRWTITGLTTLAAALALTSAMLFVHVRHLQAAADGQQIGRTHVVGYPVQQGVAPAYYIVTLHHDICPRAAAVTPWFEHLPDEFNRSLAIFVLLDLSPAASHRAEEVAERMGFDLSQFMSPNGYPETGKAWVIDAGTREIIRVLDSPSQCEDFESGLKAMLPVASR